MYHNILSIKNIEKMCLITISCVGIFSCVKIYNKKHINDSNNTKMHKHFKLNEIMTDISDKKIDDKNITLSNKEINFWMD